MTVSRNEALLALAVFWVLALMVIPLPGPVLDVMLAFSLTVGILILLLSLFIDRPLDFSVFPSLLLIVTLMRLGLNVATTRLILLHGDRGPSAAGEVIQAFGFFTVGGNFVVGIVIFLLFVVINFTVITKGAGRIAEVAARFTLDAMPGKQMAIDADLNQGIISDAEALRRRREIQREADFYGAMDGASKFVRGDAIAGILITAVNILGGLVIGVVQGGMPLSEALETYTVLTVGDGLVSQIPALVVSTASGVVVSRAASGEPLAEELNRQIFLQPRAMAVASGMLGAMAIAPGTPFVPFALFSAGTGLLARYLPARKAEEPEETPAAGPEPEGTEEAEVQSLLELDDLELEIGYGLIPLVDPGQGGELLARIRATRKQLASELGFVVPLIHIRDNLQLAPQAYTILVRGNPVASGEAPPGRLLAFRPDRDAPEIPGIPTRDPAFGLPAVWIAERDRGRAEQAGYAVVEASTAMATHLAEVIRAHADELLGRQQVAELLDQLRQRAPKVVDEIVPALVPISLVHRTLRALLRERVSIRDLPTILETLAEYAPRIQDAELLVDLVRERLARTIVRPHLEADGSLRVLTLDPSLEERLRSSVQRTETGSFLQIDPETLEGLVRGIERALAAGGGGAEGRFPVLLCSQPIRAALAQVAWRVAPRMAVLAHTEIPPEVRVVGCGVVRGESGSALPEVRGGAH